MQLVSLASSLHAPAPPLAERLARADQPVAACKRAGDARVGGAGPYNLMREVVAALVEDERIQDIARGDI